MFCQVIETNKGGGLVEWFVAPINGRRLFTLIMSSAHELIV